MRLRVQLTVAASAVLANLAATPLWAQGRIVEDVVASEQRGYVSVTLLFSCSMRYLSHTPATDGEALQVRFSAGPDCGRTSASEPQPLLAGAAGYVRSVDVVRPFGSEVQVRIGWSKPETFVLTPSIDGRLLRVRLLRAETPQVTVKEMPQGASTYAVNLASSTTPFTPDALAAAAKIVGTRTYVSETVVDEQRWYRLRAGPFVNEAAAKQALANSRSEFPKAWVAISDDDTLNEIGTPSGVATVRSTAPQVNASMTPDEIKQTLAQAKDAFRHKDYATAIPLLTQLTQQPEFPQRADAQEMLALARERSGQVAHAKAEYEDYLQRYPTGDGSTRVRKRLQALAWASRPGRSGSAGSDEDESPWRVYGGFSQIYRQDQSHIESGLAVSDLTTQNALLSDVSLVARRHGERFDFTTRASAGYSYDMLADGPGSQSRVSMLFAEFADRVAGWYARLGRQAGGSAGLMGTFDGMQAGYQLWPRLRVNGFFGFPVDSTREGPDSERKFVGVSADVGTLANAWDLSFYAVDQQYSGVTDRQAVGTEVRYFRPGITMVGLADFDIHYSTLNTVLLLGTFALPARWTLNLNLDHRKSPGLSTRNAMIGQPVRRFDELFGLYSPQQIEQLALDRTAESTDVLGGRLATLRRTMAVVARCIDHDSRLDARIGRSARDAVVGNGHRGLDAGHGLRTVRPRRRHVTGPAVPDGRECADAFARRRHPAADRRALARRPPAATGSTQARDRPVDIAGVFTGAAGGDAGQAPDIRSGRRCRDRIARPRHELRGRVPLLFQSWLSL